MQVPPVGSMPIAAIQAIMPKVPQQPESGSDNDGDSDGGAAQVKSMTAPGVGQMVDISA